MPRRPLLVVLAGPNGAGKSTTAPFLLRDELAVNEFVNADQIAAGLSGFSPDAVALAAGRIMLARLRGLRRQRVDFAFESTLASRSPATFIAEARHATYRFVLLYLWLDSPTLASARVAIRVRAGGHGIPTAIVARRYERSMQNFFRLYQPLADAWHFYDNSRDYSPRLIASGRGRRTTRVRNADLWRRLRASYDESED
jgi:predicted ABC-type ATPase